MSRSHRNLYLFIASLLLLWLGDVVLPYPVRWERLSVATAWLCMVLMCTALLIAPLQRLRGRQPPLNIYLRRDLGCWAALHGLLHFVAGNVVAMSPVYVSSFVRNNPAPPSTTLREILFSGGAILGLVIAIVFLLLLVISSDRALRWLGPVRWKKLQWSAHLALWFTVFHGIAFQLLEARYLPLVLLLFVSGVVIYGRWRAARARR